MCIFKNVCFNRYLLHTKQRGSLTIGWWNFPDLCLIYSVLLTCDHFMSAVGQPTRPTQPSIPFRAIANNKQCEMRGLFISLVIHY